VKEKLKKDFQIHKGENFADKAEVSMLSKFASNWCSGRAIAQAVIRWLPPRWPGFEPGSGLVGFVVDKVVF
jgi:hypothetical protein